MNRYIEKFLKKKLSIYWYAPGRVYRPTRQELEPDDTPPVGKPGPFFCPKCKTKMIKKPYKLKEYIYICPSCFFVVLENDLLSFVEEK